jgi:hypothetical protein
MYIHFVLILLILLITTADHAAARMKFAYKSIAYQLPTYDLYQIETPYYEATSPLLLPIFNISDPAPCKLAIPPPRNISMSLPSGTNQSSSTAGIVGIHWALAEHAGCRTYTQVMGTANTYILYLNYILTCTYNSLRMP